MGAPKAIQYTQHSKKEIHLLSLKQKSASVIILEIKIEKKNKIY